MKLPQVPSHFTIHGHRGSRGTHPENTLPSFQEAADAGAHFIELDVRLTKDDVWVVYHDPLISSRLCLHKNGEAITRPEAVRALTAKTIRERFTTGSIPQTAFPKQKTTVPLPLPTLAEILEWRARCAPRTQLNIEIKMDDAPDILPTPAHAAALMIQLLREWKSISNVQFQSFDHRLIDAALKLERSLLTACLFEHDVDFSKATGERGAQIAGPDFQLLSPAKIDQCHALGIRVIPWTVNREEDWRRLIAWGVDGIITDYPRDLQTLLTPA